MPNVDSGLVELVRRPPPSTVPKEQVFTLVDAAFAQRRKTLRAALTGWAGSAATAEQVLRAAGVDPSARGEQLTVGDFARIAVAGRAGNQVAAGRAGNPIAAE
jgi:16S rRNA (adenine1518-N6/adenine1519-N6)-dimethyltransferase